MCPLITLHKPLESTPATAAAGVEVLSAPNRAPADAVTAGGEAL